MAPDPAAPAAMHPPDDDPTEATAGPLLRRPRCHRLTAEQQLYLEAGLDQRRRYFGEPAPERSLEYELTLALSWFRNWWQGTADRQAARRQDTLTLPLPGLDTELPAAAPTHAPAPAPHD